jgi:hypothetical protein
MHPYCVDKQYNICSGRCTSYTHTHMGTTYPQEAIQQHAHLSTPLHCLLHSLLQQLLDLCAGCTCSRRPCCRLCWCCCWPVIKLQDECVGGGSVLRQALLLLDDLAGRGGWAGSSEEAWQAREGCRWCCSGVQLYAQQAWDSSSCGRDMCHCATATPHSRACCWLRSAAVRQATLCTVYIVHDEKATCMVNWVGCFHWPTG